MIRVELGEEVRSQNKASKWRWSIADVGGRPLVGLSREPLLDACRVLGRMGVNPRASAGLYRGRLDPEGRPVPDLTCTVGAGAKLTVVENEKIGPVFRKWEPRPMVQFRNQER